MFVVCMIPIHIWSLVNAFREVPAWIFKMSLWEVSGVVAYTQSFALFESIVVVLLLALVLFLVPRFMVGEDIIPIGMMIVIPATVWIIILQLNADWIDERNSGALGIWFISLVAVIGVMIILVDRSRRLQVLSQQVLDRITVLAIFLLLIDLLSVVVVVVRNIGGSFS